MLAVQAWSGFGSSGASRFDSSCVSKVALQRKIELVSRLGGKVVGYLDAPDKSLNAFQKVRDMQRQASRLCPHTTRTYEDIVLYVGQVQVGPPNMAYVDDLDFDQTLEVLKMLKDLKSIQFMWDEDDTYATQVAHSFGCSVWRHQPWDEVVVKLRYDSHIVPNECAYFAKQAFVSRRPLGWRFVNPRGLCQVADFGFLKRVKDVRYIRIFQVRPTTWSDMNTKQLALEYVHFDCANLEALDRLEHLDIRSYGEPVINLRKLSSLDKLRYIRLSTKMTKYVCQDFLHVARNSKIQEVVVNAHNESFYDESFVHQLLSIPRLEYIHVYGRTKKGESKYQEYFQSYKPPVGLIRRCEQFTQFETSCQP